MRANVEHNQVLHEHVLILSIETMPAPHVPATEGLEIDGLVYKDDRIVHITARFGYMDEPNVPRLSTAFCGPWQKPFKKPSPSGFGHVSHRLIERRGDPGCPW